MITVEKVVEYLNSRNNDFSFKRKENFNDEEIIKRYITFIKISKSCSNIKNKTYMPHSKLFCAHINLIGCFNIKGII